MRACLISLFTSISLLYGCVSVIPLDREHLIKLESQPEIGVAYYEPTYFGFHDKVPTGGLMGYYMTVELGKIAREKYDIVDPTLVVKTKFLERLKSEMKLTNLREIGQSFPRDFFQDVKEVYGGPLVFDFMTTRWDAVPVSGYFVYRVRARLIRSVGSKTLWRGICEVERSNLGKNVLLESDGTLLKTLHKEAEEKCANILWDQFLGSSSRLGR